MADEQRTEPTAKQISNTNSADKEKTTVGDVFQQARDIKQQQEAIAALDAQKAHKITVNIGEYDPELDPDSPQFNPEKYAAAVADAKEKMQESLATMKQTLAASVTEAIGTDTLQQLGQLMTETVQPALKTIVDGLRSFYNSDVFKGITDAARYIIDNNDVIRERLEEWEALQPYLEAELKKPQYESRTLDDLLANEYKDENGDTIPGSLLEQAIENARLARLAAETIPQLQSTGTPKYYTSPNTALSNALQANDGKGEVVGAGPIDLPVLSVGKPNEVTIYVNATLENMEGVTITGKPYTEYDRAVHDAVVSLYEDRTKQNMPPVMTADMVYRTMTHKTGNEFVSPQQRGAVTKSIEKMRRNISVYADATAEMQRRGVKANGKPIDSFIIDGFLLSADRLNIKAGGDNAVAYLLKGEPLLLEYAKLTGQLITVKGKLLDIREVDKQGNITNASLANNENRIAIKSYLLRRIEVMRSDEKRAADALHQYNKKRRNDETLPAKTVSDFRKQNHTILIESLFAATGITADRTKTRSREYINQVLDYWKASSSIKGYKQRKKGKTIDAVIIDL